MPVSVSLLKLVAIAGTRDVWPEDFLALVIAAEDNEFRDDRGRLGVIADWCDEMGETELGAAFRWLCKRPEVEIHRQSWGWSLGKVPRVLGYDTVQGAKETSLCGVVAALADRLAELKASLT